MDNRYFLLFHSHLAPFECCVHPCFAAVSPTGTSCPGRSDLWITGCLFKNYPHGCSGSAFKRLFEHMQLLVQLRQLLALATDLAHRVQHGGMVAAAK